MLPGDHTPWRRRRPPGASPVRYVTYPRRRPERLRAVRKVVRATVVPSAGVGEQGMVRAHEWDVSRRLARAPGRRRPWWVAHPVSARSALRLEWECTGRRAVVAVSGDLDVVTTAHLEAVVAEQPLTGCRALEVDLRGVPSIGSAGLSVLLGVRRWCLQRGIELRIRGAQPSVWRVFELAGLDLLFAPAAELDLSAEAQELTLF
jgi:anti-anti-sigma factor